VKARDLVSYFAKKIAAPIPYDVEFARGEAMLSEHNFYEIELTAVRDDVVHAIVVLKRSIVTDRDARPVEISNRPHYCGEVKIPLKNGDTVTLALDMALCGTHLGDSHLFDAAYCHGAKRLSEAGAVLGKRLERAI